MTVIIDYGVGNLFSLQSSLASIGAEAKVTADPQEILSADRIILPGVGAFADAAEKLRLSGLVETLVKAKEDGVPMMGICLGMQLLFEKSYEYGCHDGLGFLKGDIVAIADELKKTGDPQAALKIPHMGWNALQFTAGDGSPAAEKHPLFKYINDGDFVYFVHSYCAVRTDALIAVTEYGASLTAAVAKGNVMGCQFHPEKSGGTGLKILKAFCEMERSTLC